MCLTLNYFQNKLFLRFKKELYDHIQYYIFPLIENVTENLDQEIELHSKIKRITEETLKELEESIKNCVLKLDKQIVKESVEKDEKQDLDYSWLLELETGLSEEKILSGNEIEIKNGIKTLMIDYLRRFIKDKLTEKKVV